MAHVIGQPRSTKVVEVRDGYTVTINKGENDGVAEKQLYLIYYLGNEMFDPDTKESLGQLEIVCGEAIVTHVQERMATLESNMFELASKKVIRKPSFSGIGTLLNPAIGSDIEEEIVNIRERLPFKGISVNCLAKQIMTSAS
jgi:hypothetical protein